MVNCCRAIALYFGYVENNSTSCLIYSASNKWAETRKEALFSLVEYLWDKFQKEKIDIEELDLQDSELERQFRNTANTFLDDIHSQLVIASNALDKAVELSEAHGIPFSSCISFLGQSYFPSSLNDKFGNLDREFIESITSATNPYGEGWEHSAVCD